MAEVEPFETATFTITISNPNATAATLTAITDALPAGRSYVAGSTTGVTSADPEAGPPLRWAGPFQVPGGGSATLSFEAIAPDAPGVYTNLAGGEAVDNTVEPGSVNVTVPAPPAVVLSIGDASGPCVVTEGDSGGGRRRC